MTSTPSGPHERLRRAAGDAAVPGPRVAEAEIAGLTVLAELGRGPRSAVYRVRRGGAEYALKLLDRPGDAAGLVAFRRDAALTASLDHPGLPRVHEAGEAGGHPYLVMDLVTGRALADVLADGALPEYRAVAIAEELAGALAAVHRAGLVHGDVTPRNVVVTETGEVRLVGIRLTAPGDAADSGRNADIAEDPDIADVAYAAPERSGATRRAADHRADLYSLGVLIFESVTGRRPFPATDAGELRRAHAAGPAPDPRELRPGVSQALAAVLGVLLATDPEERYAGAEDLVADLRRAARSGDGFRATPLDVSIDRATELPLCGRDVEFARLAGAWGRASDGAGSVAVVRGAPGIGKTRVALEIALHARGQGALVLHGAAAADDPVPLAPLRWAVEAHLLATETLPDAERDAAHDRLRTAAGAGARLLAALSPALARVLAVTAPGERPGRQPPEAGTVGREACTEDRREQFATAVTGFLTGLAHAHGGLLLLLDDVQWLDTGTRRVVEQLGRRLGTVPLLVVATCREDGAALGLTAGTDVPLGPLDEDGVRALVTAHLPGIDRGSELARLLTARGGGNPFVVREYLRAVVDAGLLRPAWGTWLLDTESLDARDLPRDPFGLVQARAGDLGDDARRILGAAAAVGVRFRPGLVADVCGVAPERVLDVVGAATMRRLVEARDGGDHGFVHERIREALVAALEPGDLAELHARIATALDVSPDASPDVSPGEAVAGGPDPGVRTYALAHHYLQAGPAADPARVAVACAAAAAVAAADHAPGQAVTFYDHAVAAGHPVDPAFLLGFGTALARTGRYADAIERLRAALVPGTPPLVRAAVLAVVADACRATWDTDGARTAVDAGLAALGHRRHRSRPVLLLTGLIGFTAGAFVRVTRLGAGRAAGERRRRYELIATLHALGGYVGTLSMRPTLAITHHLRAGYVVERLGPGPSYVRSSSAVGFVLARLRLRRASGRAFARATRAAAAIGDPRAVAMVAWYRGCTAFMTGQDSGETWLRAVEEHGHWLDVGQFSDAVASITWEAALLGRAVEARAWYDTGVRRLAAGAAAEQTALLTVGAVVHSMAGRQVAAAAQLREVEAALAGSGGLGLRVNFVLAQLHTLLEQGELGEPFEEVVAAFRALGLNPVHMIRQHRTFFAHHAWGRLAQARAARGQERPIRLAAAREAVELLERVASTPALRTMAAVARADLHVLEGRPRRALRLASEVRPLRPDAPLLAFETARVRARACLALGLREEAERMISCARGVATAETWPNRLRWLAAEFGAEFGTAYDAWDGGGPGSAVPSAGAAFPARPADVARLRLAAQADVVRAAANVLDPEVLAGRLLDTTIRLLTADRAALFLAAGPGPAAAGDLELFAARDAAGNDVASVPAAGLAVVKRVGATGEAQVATGDDEPDAAEGLGAGAPDGAGRRGRRSVLAAPLRLDGRLLGVVYLDSPVARGVFTADDADLLTVLTASIATSVETARAARRELTAAVAGRQRDVAEALRTAFAAVSAAPEPAGVLRELASHAGRVLRAERSWLLPPDGTEPPRPVTGSGGRGAPAAVAPDIPSAWSWLVLPLSCRGTSLGLLVLCSPARDAYREPELETAAALVTQSMTAYENATLRTR